MTPWHAFAGSAGINALGWALLNFVWQGTLLAFVLRCLLALLRHHSASLRYWTATLTLFLLPLVPLGALCKPHRTAAPAAPTTREAIVEPVSSALADGNDRPRDTVPGASLGPLDGRSDAPPTAAGVHGLLPDVQRWLPDWLPALASLLWILGITALAAITSLGLARANRLRKNARPMTVRGDLADVFHRSRVPSSVRLLESDDVMVPTVVGWRRPAVLFPAGTALDSSPLRALLAHELAHVRRRDYLVNVLQSAVETALFFHPAAWWTSAQVRQERECCCDDAAVAACGDLRTYVRALSDAEQRLPATKLAVALGSTPLVHRIRRLTEMKAAPRNSWTVWVTATAIFALLAALSTASTLAAFMPARGAAAVLTVSGGEMHGAPTLTAPIPTRQAPTARASETERPEHLAIQDASALPDASRPRAGDGARAIASPERGAQGVAPLVGTIYDASGAVIPGVSVTLRDAQQAASTVMTDAAGRFQFPSIAAGSYALEAALPGFRTLRQNIELRAAQDWDRVITLQLGQLSETVVVSTPRVAPSTPAPAQPMRLKVGGNVRMPRKIAEMKPVYPDSMRDAGREASVSLDAVIGTDGSVTSVRVVSADIHPDFAIAAADAVRQWKFDPVRLNGVPVEVQMTVTVEFRLSQ